MDKNHVSVTFFVASEAHVIACDEQGNVYLADYRPDAVNQKWWIEQ